MTCRVYVHDFLCFFAKYELEVSGTYILASLDHHIPKVHTCTHWCYVTLDLWSLLIATVSNSCIDERYWIFVQHAYAASDPLSAFKMSSCYSVHERRRFHLVSDHIMWATLNWYPNDLICTINCLDWCKCKDNSTKFNVSINYVPSWYML